MADQKVQIVIEAVNNARAALEQIKAQFGEVGGEIRNAISPSNAFGTSIKDMALSFGIAQLAVQAFHKAVSLIAGTFERGFQAAEEFNVSVASTAAILTTFSAKAKTDLPGAYKDAHSYAALLVEKVEEWDAKTVATGRELMAIVETLAQGGVVLDVNNKKQEEGFIAIANALKLLTQGQNQEIQIRQEIRALVEGDVRAISRLATVLERQIGGSLEEHVKKWKEKGTLIENAGELLKGFSAAGKDIESTWMAVRSTLDTVANRILRDAFKPVYQDIVSLGKDFSLTMMDGGQKVNGVKEAVSSGLLKAWIAVKGIVESIGIAIAAIKEPLTAAWGLVVKIFEGWGAIFAILPAVVTRLGLVVQSILESVKMIGNLGAALYYVITLQFDKARAAVDASKENWKKSGQNIADAFGSGFLKEVDSRLAKYYSASVNVSAGAVSPPKMMPPPGGEDKGKKAPSRMTEWDTELAAQRDAYEKMKLAQGSYEEFSKESELKFWQEKLLMKGLSKEESNAIEKKGFELEKSIRKEAFNVELADIKGRMDAYASGSADRIGVAKDTAEKIGRAYGTESLRYKQAMKEVEREEREHQENMKKLRADADAAIKKQIIDLQNIEIEAQRKESLGKSEIEKERLGRKREMGEISRTEELEALRLLATEEYAIELQALESKALLLEGEVVQQQQVYDRILDLKRKHNLDMEKLDTQLAMESKARWSKMLAPISSAFSTAIRGVIQGTTTLKDAVKNILQSIVLSFIDMGIQMLTEWIATQLGMTTVTTTGAQTRAAIQVESDAVSAASTKMAALSQIPPLAAVAASGAAAAMASIPYVGPILAAAAFAETMALVLSSLSLVAAEGGYDVPGNVMANLHAREMVLPAHLADRVRNMTEPGKTGDFIFAPKITAMDGKDVIRVLRNNRSGLNKMFTQSVRDYHFSRGVA